MQASLFIRAGAACSALVALTACASVPGTSPAVPPVTASASSAVPGKTPVPPVTSPPATTLPPAPVPSSSSPSCNASLWGHVYHSYRLHVISVCITVTGTIEVVRLEADGDDHILLKPDAPYAKLLNAENISRQHGDLVLEPVCMHAVTQSDAVASCQGYSSPLVIPPDGTHVSVTGSYVLDADHGWMEIHPVSSLTAAP